MLEVSWLKFEHGGAARYLQISAKRALATLSMPYALQAQGIVRSRKARAMPPEQPPVQSRLNR